jgi:hypothetical protein
MEQLAFTDFFEAHFENFYREKSIGNNPAFGICYMGRSSQPLPMEYSSSPNLIKNPPLIYELGSHEENSHDLRFISNLNNWLRKNIGSRAHEEYNYKIGLITIPAEHTENPEVSRNDLTNLIYSFVGMKKETYEQNTNRVRERRTMDNLAASLIIWSLKNEKNIQELIFNYHIEELPNQLLRILKGRDLDKFIGEYSSNGN